MNLRKKKTLAAKTFGVGESRIKFVNARLEEIKEAITKQDIRDLQKDGAIIVIKIKGRKRHEKRKKRNIENMRKNINKRKKEYMKITRKLRKYLSEITEKLTKTERE